MSVQSEKILIVGSGATGLALALALAQRGQASTLIGKLDMRKTGRTVALFEGSVRFFRNINLLHELEPCAAPLQTMRIIDDTGSLFRPPPASFKARELGLDAFGMNIENHRLVDILSQKVKSNPLIHFQEKWVEDFEFGAEKAKVTLDDKTELSSQLIVAADGINSPARKAAHIATSAWSYPQMALTCILAHQKPHNEISTEFHTRQGPFTLVPLVGTSESAHRSSLVWLMEPKRDEKLQHLLPEQLAWEIEKQAQSFLGKMSLEVAAHIFPMRGMIAKPIYGRRLALIGEAAHAFPPIGAQGLNLGLRDVAHLVDVLEKVNDPGAESVLMAYEHARQGDIALRAGGVDVLNRSLLAQMLPFDFLRGAGLLTIANLGPLRKLVMRTGLMPHGTQPSLMRAAH